MSNRSGMAGLSFGGHKSCCDAGGVPWGSPTRSPRPFCDNGWGFGGLRGVGASPRTLSYQNFWPSSILFLVTRSDPYKLSRLSRGLPSPKCRKRTFDIRFLHLRLVLFRVCAALDQSIFEGSVGAETRNHTAAEASCNRGRS